MTGYENYNRAAFHEMAAKLQSDGYEVENPATVSLEDSSWAEYMKGVEHLLRCDTVIVLPGWQESKGARLEIAIAHHLGIPILCYPEKVELIDRVEFRIARTYDGLLV